MLLEARHLRPDQKTKPVGPVEPAGILCLLVLASPIEAERLRQLDVPLQGFVARRGQQAAGEIALVQDKALDVRLAVQPASTVTSFDRAQPEVALDPIRDPAVRVEKRSFQVAELRRIRMPGTDTVK